MPSNNSNDRFEFSGLHCADNVVLDRESAKPFCQASLVTECL